MSLGETFQSISVLMADSHLKLLSDVVERNADPTSRNSYED